MGETDLRIVGRPFLLLFLLLFLVWLGISADEAIWELDGLGLK